MFRITALCLPGAALALVTSCSSSSAPPAAPPPPPSQPQADSDLAAVRLGVAIDARAPNGAPRLIRAIVPRPGATGMTADEAARDHLTALTPLWLPTQRPADLSTRGVQRLRNGASLVRLEQQIDRVPIHQSELHVLVHPDGALAAVSGTMLASTGRPAFQLSASAALDRALDEVYGAARARPAITEAPPQDGYSALTVADDPEFRVQVARERRELMLDGDRLVPIHAVELFAEKISIDRKVDPIARRLLIADSGRVLRNVNLTASDAFVYRALAETTGNRIPLDGPLESFAPHPTGVPDGSLPGFGPYNLVVQDAFNGPRDPWLSPTATTTSGNNVDAFADIAPPSGFGAGDIRPEVRAGRTLNYRYDFTAEPLATTDQSKAAAVNVFYVTNWMHDWWYDSGFTEATGNAQVDNLGRGGIAGDPLIAHAQADALGGSRDNANMTTPADGLSPVMNMFLWTGASEASLTTAAGSPPVALFTNGPHNFDVSAEVVAVVDVGTGGASACGPVTDAVAGKIAFVRYVFACASADVMDNVKAAGAIGVIAVLDFPGIPALTLSGSPTANIPGMVLGFADGNALAAALPTSVTLHLATTIEHDGDFDNAIIAHEWGHYLHHRLASCEVTFQCTGMSEGWGDFNALLMLLRPTDNRDGTFGPGVYALSAGGLAQFGFTDPGYFGIRRFPYSLDRRKNGLSFRHIGDGALLPDTPTNPGPAANFNSEVHNMGEVWAQMLWEVYNVLIDEHGAVESHRRMTDYVVAGLLLTPPEATFTEARDAILAAAGALDTDDMLLMAAAFAGRGAGTCAVSPPNTSFDQAGVVESGTVAARLATSTATLVDDGASCDHDGYLDPGESGTLRITLANSGVVAAESIVARATTSTPGVTLGKPVLIDRIAPLSQVDVAIPVRLAATAPTSANLDIAIDVTGDAGCNTGHLALGVHEHIGVDEAPASATSDGFETRSLGWTLTGAFAGQLWTRTGGTGANHVLFGTDASFPTDTQVVSPVLEVSTNAPLVVTLMHAFDLERASDLGPFFDGAVLEVSSDGGATWQDVTEVGADPGYPVIISPDDPTNPLQGRPGFGGRSPGFPALQPVTLDFGMQLAGRSVQLRLRLVSDFCCNATGWIVDDVAVTGVTNTPFTALVPEPTRCTARTVAAGRAPDDSIVVDVRQMPFNRLAGVPLPEP
ncbi:MAG TPA: M36 family metallopeptidase [Kofleriaceae bacterium]|nr:M36 family metallopeptidase [Kofleriaceae bacterium]